LLATDSRHDKLIAEFVEPFVHRPTSSSKGAADSMAELVALGGVVISHGRTDFAALRLFQFFWH